MVIRFLFLLGIIFLSACSTSPDSKGENIPDKAAIQSGQNPLKNVQFLSQQIEDQPSANLYFLRAKNYLLLHAYGLADQDLEKALRAHDRLGGHIVSGHVDGIGHVTHFAQVGESWELRIQAPAGMGKYLAYKGSITVNGVSLTVNKVTDTQEGCEFSINLIPHTVDNTALGTLQQGSAVNLEIDLIARYVERMLSNEASANSAASAFQAGQQH